ncbi:MULTISPECIES: hypothetical protein [Sphingomonas]|uniref:hypothetical protein n=1 Tax=Sphingomonas TaxID=13687 RepID=UPI0025503300|nr:MULTISPECIES: hypothetical protein [Sphingomonas]MDK8188429.1 hypothetical protein [Sphingomonas zeae]MDK8216346.1 hypothetical protein [Sphingomonas sp. UMB7805-LC452B]
MGKRYDWRLVTLYVLSFTLVFAGVLFTVKAGGPVWPMVLAMGGAALNERLRHD